jgi:hypothetical protein
MTVNNELERMERSNCDLISGTMVLIACNFPRGAEENYENPQDSQYPGQDSN